MSETTVVEAPQPKFNPPSIKRRRSEKPKVSVACKRAWKHGGGAGLSLKQYAKKYGANSDAPFGKWLLNKKAEAKFH